MKFIKRPTLTYETVEMEVKTSFWRRLRSLNQERTSKVFTAGKEHWNNAVIDFVFQPVTLGAHIPVLKVEDYVLYNVVPIKALDNQWVVECTYSYAQQVQ